MPSSDNPQVIEARGQSTDAAIEAGLRRLGLSRAQVTVEVIDEGSRGLLGIGSREAVVRLRQIVAPPPAEPEPVAPPAATPEPSKVEAATPPAEPPAPKPGPKKAPVAALADEAADGDEADGGEQTDETLEAERQAATEIFTELLQLMHVKATIEVETSEPDDLTGQRVNVLNVVGNDLSVLIGSRGETIEALQFLGRLMVSHRLRRRSNLIVDVEGYRQRRLQALTRMAERMGEKARQRQEPISLEPMPASERRVIHMALRDWPDVYTESVGEGKQRKVRIYPKK